MNYFYDLKFKLIKLYFRKWLFSDVPHLKMEDFLNRKDEFMIIDCRPEAEFKVSFIPNAINVPGTEVTAEFMESILEDRRSVLFYCSIGYRSSLAARNLKAEFLSHHEEREVFNLDGSIFEYANSGNVLEYHEKNKLQVARVHGYDDKWCKLLKEEFRVL